MEICYSVMFYHTSNMYTTDKKFFINKVLESNENYLSGCWDTFFNLHNFVQKPNCFFRPQHVVPRKHDEAIYASMITWTFDMSINFTHAPRFQYHF